MNHLNVTAEYAPGHVDVHTHHSEVDGRPFAVLAFDRCAGASLDLRFHDLAQVDELTTALATVREYLSTENAARDAA